MTIRSQFLQGVVSVHGAVPSDEVLVAKEKAILAARPDNVEGYAFTAGRRWAIDQKRRDKALLQQALEEDRKLQEARERAARHHKMTTEVQKVAFQMNVAGCNGRPGLLKFASILLMCFSEGMGADDLLRVFPGTSRDVRYQWKHRAVKHAAEWASPELMQWLKGG